MFPKEKIIEYKTRQVSGRIWFPPCHHVLPRPQIIVSSFILCTVYSAPN